MEKISPKTERQAREQQLRGAVHRGSKHNFGKWVELDVEPTARYTDTRDSSCVLRGNVVRIAAGRVAGQQT